MTTFKADSLRPQSMLVRYSKKYRELQGSTDSSPYRPLCCSDTLKRRLMLKLTFNPNAILKVTARYKEGYWTEDIEEVKEKDAN
jgi:hypothetical protein